MLEKKYFWQNSCNKYSIIIRKLFEKAIQSVWYDSSTELRSCLLNYIDIKKVTPPEKMTSLHFNFYRTVQVVEYFHQRNWSH